MPSLYSSGMRPSENKKIDAIRLIQGWCVPIRREFIAPERNLDVPQLKLPHCGRLEALLCKSPSPATRTTPRPFAVLAMWKESTKANEAAGLEFQQYCAGIVHFALPHNVDGTRNCHNQTASHRPIVGKNASGIV